MVNPFEQGAANSGPGVVGADPPCRVPTDAQRKFVDSKMKAEALGFQMSPKWNRDSKYLRSQSSKVATSIVVFKVPFDSLLVVKGLTNL